MRRQALALFALIVVAIAAVAALLAGYTLEGSSSPSTGAPTTSTTAVPTNCTVSFPGGLPLQSGNNRTVFILRPGATGLLCVTYGVDSSKVQGENTTVQFPGTVQAVNATYTSNTNGEGYGYAYSYSPAPGVTDTARPESFSIQRGENVSSVTVIFTISASRSSAGFYALGYPMSCPSLIPIAITTNNGGQGITAADFPGFFFSSGCVVRAPLTYAHVTGLAGMSTVLIEAS